MGRTRIAKGLLGQEFSLDIGIGDQAVAHADGGRNPRDNFAAIGNDPVKGRIDGQVLAGRGLVGRSGVLGEYGFYEGAGIK